MKNSVDGLDEITGINITPLVDVMLVLLVIFMVTANYIQQPSSTIHLPISSHGEEPQVGKTTNSLKWSITQDSRILFEEKAVQESQIKTIISDFKKRRPEKLWRAIIAADHKTPHGAVVKLIDILRSNGIHELILNVEKK